MSDDEVIRVDYRIQYRKKSGPGSDIWMRATMDDDFDTEQKAKDWIENFGFPEYNNYRILEIAAKVVWSSQ